MTATKKLLILSSGGDAPGMNAAIRATTRMALHDGLEVYAAENGYSGLINHEIFPLTPSMVGNIIQHGGTILKTGRCEEFKNSETRKKVIAYLKQQEINALVILGGDGSFRGATHLANEGNIQVIGVPCTIDNDIRGTDYCIGFDTARNTALEAIDKIRDTAYSHERNFLIEVMGRSSGFIAVDVGIAGGAEAILIPEYPLSTEELVAKLQAKKREKTTSIIVVAEAGDAGRSLKIAKQIKTLSGIEYKVCILGHTQRGGTPTVLDRKRASIMGAMAARAIVDGQTLKMTAFVNNKYDLTALPDPENATSFFEDAALLEMNNIICE